MAASLSHAREPHAVALQPATRKQTDDSECYAHQEITAHQWRKDYTSKRSSLARLSEIVAHLAWPGSKLYIAQPLNNEQGTPQRPYFSAASQWTSMSPAVV